MTLWKRGRLYWMDTVVNGIRYREPLGTTDWREAQQLQKQRIAQLESRAPDPTRRSQQYGAMTVAAAMVVYSAERRAQVSSRMVAYWQENTRPLAAFFGSIPLRKITPAHIPQYQNARKDAGRAPKTINGEIAVLRQLLKAAKLWYRFREDYTALPNTKAPTGRALTEDEQTLLFNVAARNPVWIYAYSAATLAFYCGLRACEIKGLRWKDVDLLNGLLEVRRSKTPAGWRKPTLNRACLTVLRDLWSHATKLGFTEPDHYVLPWHGRDRKIDPTRPITSWRTAWRSMLRAAGLTGVSFHHGRHTAITTLQEKGLPDWVIQAQVGHVSATMMKTYSHIRRKALNQAAAALDPSPAPRVDAPAGDVSQRPAGAGVTSQTTSQRGPHGGATH